MRQLIRALALTFLLMLTLLVIAAHPFLFSNPDLEPKVKEVGGIPMVYVPEGCFPMGSSRWERDYTCNQLYPGWFYCQYWFEGEMPQHEVCLSAFWISQTEVTNAQYAECVDAGECEPPGEESYCPDFRDPDYADHPVVCVDWYRATVYAEWLTETTGQSCSLPTEAQWEYTARGPAGNAYPWGNEKPACELANVYTNGDYCVNGTAPVGHYPAGASWVGALDIAGNVWEWTVDWYGENYYDILQSGKWDPTGPATGTLRVVRGGSWNNNERVAHAANRNNRFIYFRHNNIGFRVVCAPPSLLVTERAPRSAANRF